MFLNESSFNINKLYAYNEGINYLVQKEGLTTFKEDFEVMLESILNENVALILEEEDKTKAKQMLAKFNEIKAKVEVEMKRAKENNEKVNKTLIISSITLGISIITILAMSSMPITPVLLFIYKAVCFIAGYSAGTMLVEGINKVMLKKYINDTVKAIEKAESAGNETEENLKKLKKCKSKLKQLNDELEMK